MKKIEHYDDHILQVDAVNAEEEVANEAERRAAIFLFCSASSSSKSDWVARKPKWSTIGSRMRMTQ
jgi:hypothetical protein